MNPPRLDAPRRWHLWPRAFRQRLLAGMALALGTTMLLFTARVTFTQRRELLRQSEERGMVLAKALAVIDLPEILESDIQGLDEMIHSVSGYPDLRYAMVLTPEGRVLAHTDPAQVGRYLSDPISRQWLRGPAAPTTLTRSESLVDVAAPVLVQGRLVGWVRVGLGQQALAASLRGTLRDGAVLTALALVLGAAASLLASRHLARGIDRLVRLARETDPNRIVFLSRRDELSELGRAFDRLTQELDSRVRDLQGRERFLHDLMQHLTVSVVAHHPDGTVAYANPAALAFLGLPLERIQGRTLPDLIASIHREDGQILPAEEYPVTRVRLRRERVHGVVLGIQKKPGSPPCWALVDAFPELGADGEVQGTLLALMDITERQEAKIRLRQALADLEDLYQNAPCGYHSLGTDGTILRINETELRWIGYSREEVLDRMTFQDLLTPASRAVFKDHFPAFKREGSLKDLALDLVRKDGSTLSVLVNATAICAPDGSYLYSRSSLTDVTERLKAERALRASQHSLAEAQRIAHLGNWELDLATNTLTWSDEIYRIFEIDPSAFGASYEAFLAAVHPEDRERVDQAYQESLRSRVPYDLVHRLALPDGRIKHVREQCETTYDADGEPCRSLGTVQDITEQEMAEQERRRLESELHHFQRLESLGNLAGGVAHDMNNILSVILNLAELHLEQLPAGAEDSRAFDQIKKACLRGADLVRRLTQFARKQMESAELLDLNALVREQADVLERTTLKKAEWVLDLDPGLPPILGQASDLGNALINLCINALDAMPRGGRITLRTRCDPGGCAVLSVEDNGAGMTPEVLARALDPFFTTKPAGKGTGLGLPMVYGTMKAHGGSLELQSEPGAGTRVHLRFPPAGGTAAPASLGGSATSDLPPARVLLVDDDELVRLTVPPLLEALGLEAESVESGLQALDRLEAAPRIDLVILDQNMPQLSGAESLARIRSRWPELPVLLASGYREAEPAAYDRLATLEKPYTLDALRRALARLLGSVQPELPPRT